MRPFTDPREAVLGAIGFVRLRLNFHAFWTTVPVRTFLSSQL